MTCVYGQVLLLAQPTQGIVNEVVRWMIFVSPAAWMLWRHVTSFHQLGLWGLKHAKMAGYACLISAYAIIGVLHLIVIQHKKAHWPLSPEFWLTSFSTSTIAKEISFRGLLFFFFDRLTPKTRIILSAIAFTGIHCPGWCLFPPQHTSGSMMMDAMSVLIAGCLLGWVYAQTRSLWATCMCHALHNLIIELFV